MMPVDSTTTAPPATSPSVVPTPRPTPWAMLGTIVLIAAIGLGLGLLAGKLAKASGSDLIGVAHVSLPMIAVVVFFGLWTVLLVHELGHLVAGLAQGNRFMLFAAGPLLVRREEGVVRVRFNRTAGLWGGVAATQPRVSAGGTLRENLFRVVLWGPLASLLLTLAAAAAMPVSSGAFRLFLAMTAVCSVGIFLATTVPPRTGHFYTDGARLRMLRAGGDDAERWCTVAALAAMAMEGLPGSAWDAALLARAEQLADASLDGIMLHLVLYEHALDVDDAPRAHRHMAAVRAARAGLAPALQSYLALESAFWAAVGERDAARARAEFDSATASPFESKVARMRAEGAVLLAEGNAPAGQARLDEAAALADAARDPAMRSERARIERARRIIA